MATIKSKIIVNVVILLLTIIGIVGMEYATITTLGKIQDDGATAASDSREAENASSIGSRLYMVIADAVINRELDKIAKEWVTEKEKEYKLMEQAIKMAHTKDEKEWTAAAKKAIDDLAVLFETRMMPALKTTKGCRNYKFTVLG